MTGVPSDAAVLDTIVRAVDHFAGEMVVIAERADAIPASAQLVLRAR